MSLALYLTELRARTALSKYCCFILHLNIFRIFADQPDGSTLSSFIMEEVLLGITSVPSKVASSESVELFVFAVG